MVTKHRSSNQLALSPQVDRMLTKILVGICLISTVWGQSCVEDYIIGKASRVLFRNCDTPEGKKKYFIMFENILRMVTYLRSTTLLFHFLWLIFWKNYILFLVQNLWEQISFLRKLSWLMIIILIDKLVNNIFDNLLIFHQLNMHKLSLLK